VVTRTSVIDANRDSGQMDLNELEEAFPGSRFLAFSEQKANKPTGEKNEKIL
jgi:hypothetical protein